MKAARSEFGHHGYAGGRVDRIARGAGVNKQLIFYYFGSKAGLFRAVVALASQDLAAATTTAGATAEPLNRLRALLEGAFQAFAAHSDLLRAAVVAASPDETSPAPLAEQLAGLRKRVSALVSDAQGLGFVRDDVDPDVVSQLAVALVLGSVLLPHDASDRRIGNQTDLLIRGLAW